MSGMYGGYAGPKEVQYLFIDGEQLRRTVEEVGNDWFKKPIDIDYRKLQGTCQKVFFYDCLPARTQADTDEAYKQKRDAKEALFNELRAIAGWHVSQGLAKHRKRVGQEQKEVDILIAVDMLTHTYRRNMHRLTFLSGDQDFAPLLEAVVREGMYVELLYPERHTSTDLMHFADAATPLDVDRLYAAATEDFQRSHGKPTRSFDLAGAPQDGVWVEQGHGQAGPFAKVWHEQTSGLFNIKTVHPNASGQYFTVRNRDLALGKRYFEMHARQIFGPQAASLDWRQLAA